MKKEIIHWDKARYDLVKGREDQALAIVEELKERAEKALAKDVDNLVEFLEDPRRYVVDKFFEFYNISTAPHLNKERYIQSQIAVTLGAFDELIKEYRKLVAKLEHNAPKITPKGIQSTIKKEDYNIYLNEDLRERWEDHQKFVEYANKLKKYGANGVGHLVKYSFDLELNNLELSVNWYPYREIPKSKSA